MKQSTVYRISAVTPEEGRIVIDTLDESRARSIHSNLMVRQLNPNDLTHNVTVTAITQENNK